MEYYKRKIAALVGELHEEKDEQFLIQILTMIKRYKTK